MDPDFGEVELADSVGVAALVSRRDAMVSVTFGGPGGRLPQLVTA